MMKWVRRILITLILLYLGVLAAAFFAQRNFIYFPPNNYHAPPANMAEIKTPSGMTGWYSAAHDGRPTVMVFHGNASYMDTNLYIFRDLQAAGYGVWAVGYSGYPGNAGPAAQANIVAGAAEQYELLKARGVTNIIYYGTSLGSGVAAQLALRHEPEILILDAPFNSMSDMARYRMPILPTGILLKDTWRSDKVLKELDIPLIWFHGTKDRVIPISQGQKLYDGYNGPKTALVIPGSNHFNTWHNGGREVVLSALKNCNPTACL